jgi:excisionase family DNA binding protein
MTAPLRTRRNRPGRTIAGERLGAMTDLLTTPTQDSWFTTDSLAQHLRVSDRLVRKWVAEGRLRSYKLDGCRRFDPVDVADFVAGMRDRRAGTP